MLNILQYLSITNLLVIFTCVTSYACLQNRELFEANQFYPYRMAHDKSYYRFSTSGFVHGDYQHLLFNMITMYSIGNTVESVFKEIFPMGAGLYILLYLSGIVMASVADYFKHQHNPSFAAIGASGGTSAITFAYIFFAPWNKILFFIIPMPAIVFGVIYLVVSTVLARRGGGNIGHNAHFWGGVYGFVFCALVASILRPEFLQSFIDQMRF
jgi:membrane associated rhomboid family serine protease